MATPDDVLHLLGSGDTARPRLSHYDDTGRIELSGRVLLNWVAKAANLLQEEFDASVGSTVRIDLPPAHWRALYWALAAWAVGATVESADRSGVRTAETPADVLLTDDPSRIGPGDRNADVVVVTLAALARSHPAPLPEGVLDEAAVLATYGDVVDPWASAVHGDTALAADHRWSYADVVPEHDEPHERLLLVPSGLDSAAALRAALGAWACDGSVVVASLDLPRVVSDELVTRTLGAS